jgi:hypothetical protein
VPRVQIKIEATWDLDEVPVEGETLEFEGKSLRVEGVLEHNTRGVLKPGQDWDYQVWLTDRPTAEELEAERQAGAEAAAERKRQANERLRKFRQGKG